MTSNKTKYIEIDFSKIVKQTNTVTERAASSANSSKGNNNTSTTAKKHGSTHVPRSAPAGQSQFAPAFSAPLQKPYIYYHYPHTSVSKLGMSKHNSVGKKSCEHHKHNVQTLLENEEILQKLNKEVEESKVARQSKKFPLKEKIKELPIRLYKVTVFIFCFMIGLQKFQKFIK
ncbi:hypothetical protein EV182_007569 [Spiromyces aspiralis]|uniref:Uncharacterized protein n=1 Tax=Spiromyces aspiralis TaxID=68401 RepID=A0ACC1HJL7_9FUNG|nr:hypothetical protein EV182_007569 [Spiromyces aspiralis]